MSLTLSSGDVEQLRTSLRLLLAPSDFPDPTVWRLAICEHLLQWIHNDAVHITLDSVGSPIVGVGRWSPDSAKEFASRWRDRVEPDTVREQRGLCVTVRQELISTEDFQRTAYWREFCAPHKILDSATAIHRFADGAQVILHLNSSHAGTFPPGGRTHEILKLLQPALAAGAAVVRAMGDAWPESENLDRAPSSIGLLALDGRLLHATPRLLDHLSDPALAPALSMAMTELAVAMGRLLSDRSKETAVRPCRGIQTERGHLDIRASIVDHVASGGQPLCLVAVTFRPRPSRVPSLRDRFGLTDRETQTAVLLARGRRNSEIALALGVSAHTARRHTEHVLQKLGIDRRAGVSDVLGNGASATGTPNGRV